MYCCCCVQSTGAHAITCCVAQRHHGQWCPLMHSLCGYGRVFALATQRSLSHKRPGGGQPSYTSLLCLCIWYVSLNLECTLRRRWLLERLPRRQVSALWNLIFIKHRTANPHLRNSSGFDRILLSLPQASSTVPLTGLGSSYTVLLQLCS